MSLANLGLKDKIAIVTGGGQGIGKAIALGLAEYGAAVCIADLNGEVADEVAVQIKGMGERGIGIQVDVTDPSLVHRMVETTLEAYGRIDILVNSAGGASGADFGIGRVLKISEQDWDRTFAVNLKSVFLCTRAVARTMLEQKDGSIINIASLTGEYPFAGMPAYSAAKAGVINLTKSLAMELAPHVRVNAIAPGLVETLRTSKNRTAEQLEYLLSNVPLGRMGTPEEVADVAIYLASRAASWITGTVVDVNGGQAWMTEGGRPRFRDES